jgi:4-amino-4-deoxy-L-arabinose transferase-like glycosyltransferase
MAFAQRPASTPRASSAADSALVTRELGFTLALAVVALLPRLFVAVAWAREPVWDGHYYHFGAERIAHGLGYSEDVVVRGLSVWKPWTHYPVGYSGLLGLAYALFGSGLIVAPVVNALIGMLLVLVVYRLARYYLSETRARIAAGLAALHPGLIAYTAVVMTEPLAALLLLTAAWAAIRHRGRWRGMLLAGMLLGFAGLTRTSSLLALPLLVLITPRPWSRSIIRSAAAALVTFAVIAPWTVRNCMRMDGCALVSTNGGWNLAIGALTDTGRFVTLRAEHGCPIVTGQVQQDRCWAKVGRDVIRTDPVHWLALIPKKLSHTYDHESFAIEYLREANPAAWPESRRIAARALLTTFHRLLLAVAALACVAFGGFRGRVNLRWAAQAIALLAVGTLAAHAFLDDSHAFYRLAVLMPLFALLPLPGRPHQGPVGRYLLGLLAVTTVTHAIFFGDDRYHIVVTPALCILAAAALRSSTGERDSAGTGAEVVRTRAQPA